MSDGMSDASAEGELYRRVVDAVYYLRECMGSTRKAYLWNAAIVDKVNELLSDSSYQFQRAPYAQPPRDPSFCGNRDLCEDLFITALRLRKALTASHRGWAIEPAPDGDGQLCGSGYLLVRR